MPPAEWRKGWVVRKNCEGKTQGGMKWNLLLGATIGALFLAALAMVLFLISEISMLTQFLILMSAAAAGAVAGAITLRDYPNLETGHTREI